MVVILTSELMLASTASSHGKQHQVKVAQVGSVEKALKVIKENRPHVFLVDLQVPKLNVAELGEQIAALADAVAPLTIAYAQHVEVELLESAKQAGFDQVLTRGQLNSQLGRIVADAK
ncbi:MAG: response regulator [Planctomycetota bacterium]